jgi:hypothetical protein
MEPKEIWPSSTVELLGDAGEKAIKSMNSMPKILTAGAN